MDLRQRAAVYAALGDETRLRLVDALWLNDLTPLNLRDLVGIDSNLLAHHLGVLERAGVVERHTSSGDARRRYVSLRWEAVRDLVPRASIAAGSILFVCTHNSARSQFAQGLLAARGTVKVESAGLTPSARVHPKARQVAAEHGLDLARSRPKPYTEVTGSPDLVISVCDRAGEAPIPFHGRRLHWSVADPVVTNRLESFRRAFEDLSHRVDLLVDALN